MAWNDGPGVADKDLMGIEGDILFADPLNIRGGVPPGGAKKEPKRPVVPFSASASPRASPPGSEQRVQGRSPQFGDELDSAADLAPREEEGTWFGNMMWSFAGVVGGKQCCSMRDRTVAAEAAKRAAATGRPPSGDDPDSSRRGNEDVRPPRDKKFPDAAGSSDGESTPRVVHKSEVQDGPLSPGRENADPEDKKRSAGSAQASKASLNLPADDLLRPKRDDRPVPAAAPKAQKPPAVEEHPPMATATPDSVKKRMPAHWEWPPWALNFKAPCIEVFVVDDETNSGKWCEAEPQARVVDGKGGDAYLSAEYDWDGEFYVQDFGPHHVRRRAHKETVFQLFDTTSRKGFGGIHDDDKVSQASQGKRVAGAGVMDFLNESR